MKLDFNAGDVRKELEWYVSMGFRSITSFGVFLNEEYYRQYGEPPIEENAQLLQQV